MAALLLTDAELRHFGAKGWVLRERVLTPSECQRLIGATDREQNRGKGKLRPNAKVRGGRCGERRGVRPDRGGR